MKVSVSAILVMFLWASCFPLIVMALEYAPVMFTAFYRALFAGVFLTCIAFILKRPFPTGFKHWVYLVMIGLTATSIGFWGMFYAGNLLTPGLATVLTNTQPLIAALLGWFILKEQVSPSMGWAMLIGFVGIIIIGGETIWTSDDKRLYGMIYILIAASGIAISNVLLKKIAKKVDVYYAMGLQLIIGAIPFGIFCLFQNEPVATEFLWPPFESKMYLVLVITLAIPGTALPFLLWFWLMDKAPLYQLNTYSFLTPIIGLLIGWLFFNESLSMWQWIGISIVFISIVQVTRVLNSTERQHVVKDCHVTRD